MRQPLSAFSGDAIYLDAMILVGFTHPRSPWNAVCRQSFQRAIDAARPIRLVTATLTIDDAFDRCAGISRFAP